MSAQCEEKSREKKDLTLCEGKEKELSCGQGRILDVSDVNYGHLDETTCRGSDTNEARNANNGSNSAGNENNNENSGTTAASNSSTGANSNENAGTTTTSSPGSTYVQCKAENALEKVQEL